jgi:2-succinyl-6-hydroxy-2,4-cyclohexadiene-1-carboxylate synthase
VPADRLHASVSGTGPRIVLVHGFTQTGRSWAPIADRLADRFEIVAVDAPGHGRSARVEADLDTGAELLAVVGGAANYAGYSMGGRLCLHLALAHPEIVDRLVLVSATAGIEDERERATRRAADDALATMIERDGVDAFLEGWVAQPMFATLDDPGLEDRRRNDAGGLASSVRLAGTGTQRPLWDRLPALTMPVLVVAGALDAKFTALAERMAGLIPDATLAIVDGAGHTVHLERPDEFADLLAAWLNR